MHGTVTEDVNEEHNGHSYKKHITKAGAVVARTTRHIKQTLTHSKKYLQDQILMNNEKSQCRDDIYRQYKNRSLNK